MQVTLAYEFDGFPPDETVEVDDLVGRELLRTGRARPADLTDATIDEVKAAVGTSPELARAALDAERARPSPRKRLVAHLETVADPASGHPNPKE